MGWKVYIVECADKSLYTGVTVDIKRRIDEHNNSSKGARYTRTRRPVSLVYQESYESRSEACSREYALKKLTRTEKLTLIKSGIQT